MRFWDASAVVPLLVPETATAAMRRRAEEDPEIVVAWTTHLECVSALRRAERAGRLDAPALIAAIERLDRLAETWSEVPSGEAVRWIARRLLLVHPLRAADAVQLAAALTLVALPDAGLDFVCLDERLHDAAAREGLRVVAS